MYRKRKTFQHFSREELEIIFVMWSKGKSVREIARKLNRGEGAIGSISRALRRGRHPSPLVDDYLTPLERARYTEEKALAARKKPRRKGKLECDPALRREVIRLLVDEQASPRDISMRIKDELGKRIAYTTIYRFTKTDRIDLRKYLRLRGKARRQRVANRRCRFKEGLPPKKHISLRPSIVETREEFGHYEADTIHGAKGGSGAAILTVRERASRKRWYFLISDLEAETTLAVLRGFFRKMPGHMRRTITVDNGAENAHLYELEKTFPGFQVFYCTPYAAYERGSVENANGEFRWYYPKGSEFANLTLREIWNVQDKINRRRMIVLERKSAEAVFAKALRVKRKNTNNTPLLLSPNSSTLNKFGSNWMRALLR